MRNQRGQAAILVALMFNVLFVFFAMSINVALVVHDKINLQNSADMAAYYAAAKQSEMLNAIAHENYAIRQSWKLLAWRYHVLGTMGLYRAPSPPNPVWSGEVTDTVYPPAVKPVVCVTYKPTWKEVPDDESLCNTENLRIPPLPLVKVIAGFLSINAGIAALSQQLRAQFDAQCERHGAYNWWFAASIMQTFRIDQRNRKQIIYALAKNLSNASTDGDFLDLDGNSVLQGARQTFLKNLTYANRESFQAGGGEFKLFNSLGGIDPKQWLVEIQTVPTILYTDVDSSAGCNASTHAIKDLPERPEAVALLRAPFPGGLQANELIPWMTTNAGFLKDNDYAYSQGVEKNPWYMAYMGVKVSTTPRQIFFPAGGGVAMKARAFAKPFGGRIGPWYKASWPQGAKQSDGDLVDALLPPRIENGGLMNSEDDPRRLPNYSRYPGDQLGMQSKLAINALVGLGSIQIEFDFYKNIWAYTSPSSVTDPLAWNGPASAEPDIRNYEIAALAPDLFDITYYSVEPNFSKNYYEKIAASKDKFGIPSDVPIRTDLGQSINTLEYSVQEQMGRAQEKALQRPEA
ncbi:MAG: TadE/TadG family type IV pilus assembly protein, partial [Bdellovibrionales bacterium]